MDNLDKGMIHQLLKKIYDYWQKNGYSMLK